jgi:hypothetical protein
MADPLQHNYCSETSPVKISRVFIVVLLPLHSQIALADGSAEVLTRHQRVAPGVKVAATKFIPLAKLASRSKASAPSSGAAASNLTGAVVVAVQPHTCAPVYGSGGIPVSYTFSPIAAGDCVSFAAPAPIEADSEPRARPRRRPRPTPEQLARIAADRAIALAMEPELEVAPAQVGLTGLDSYFWLSEEPRPISAVAQVPGLGVTAEARPVQYVWDFGDGDEEVTDHAGRRWSPELEGNVSHLYESRGRYDLRVEVVWQARWRIGDGEWRHLGYFSNSDTTSYPVRQIVPVLTRSPR